MSVKIHKRCRQCNIWYKVPVYSRRVNSHYCSLSCNTTFRNINNNPTQRKEVREKIRIKAILGKQTQLRTKEAIEKQRKTISGEKHWNWQGGKTKQTTILRNKAEYKHWRKAVYERDDYTCQICKKRGGYINADHIKPWSLYPDERYNIDNGRTLCVDCHYKTPTFGYKAVMR